jgi:hypothetical protein
LDTFFGHAGGFLGSGPGGAHGFYMAEWLNALIGKTGTAFLLSVMVFIFILFSVKNSVSLIKSFKPAIIREKNAADGSGNYEDGIDKSAEMQAEGFCQCGC